MSLTFVEPSPRISQPAPALSEQLLMLRRRWRLIFATAGTVIVLTYLVLASMPIRYTATGVLLYDPDGAATPRRCPRRPAKS